MAGAQQPASHSRSRGDEQIVPAEEPTGKDSAAAVLQAYTSAAPQDAFEAAVRVYRERNPNAQMSAARRAVAEIICGRV